MPAYRFATSIEPEEQNQDSKQQQIELDSKETRPDKAQIVIQVEEIPTETILLLQQQQQQLKQLSL